MTNDETVHGLVVDVERVIAAVAMAPCSMMRGPDDVTARDPLQPFRS